MTKDCGTCSKGERLQALVSGKSSRSCLTVRAGGPDSQDLKAIHTGHGLVLPALAAAKEPRITACLPRAGLGRARTRSFKSPAVGVWSPK